MMDKVITEPRESSCCDINDTTEDETIHKIPPATRCPNNDTLQNFNIDEIIQMKVAVAEAAYEADRQKLASQEKCDENERCEKISSCDMPKREIERKSTSKDNEPIHTMPSAIRNPNDDALQNINIGEIIQMKVAVAETAYEFDRQRLASSQGSSSYDMLQRAIEKASLEGASEDNDTIYKMPSATKKPNDASSQIINIEDIIQAKVACAEAAFVADHQKLASWGKKHKNMEAICVSGEDQRMTLPPVMQAMDSFVRGLSEEVNTSWHGKSFIGEGTFCWQKSKSFTTKYDTAVLRSDLFHISGLTKEHARESSLRSIHLMKCGVGEKPKKWNEPNMPITEVVVEKKIFSDKHSEDYLNLLGKDEIGASIIDNEQQQIFTRCQNLEADIKQIKLNIDQAKNDAKEQKNVVRKQRKIQQKLQDELSRNLCSEWVVSRNHDMLSYGTDKLRKTYKNVHTEVRDIKYTQKEDRGNAA